MSAVLSEKTWLQSVFVKVAFAVALTAGPAFGDINVEGDSLVQNEISLTLRPGHSGALVMAYNDNPYNYASCAGLGIAYRACCPITVFTQFPNDMDRAT